MSTRCWREDGEAVQNRNERKGIVNRWGLRGKCGGRKFVLLIEFTTFSWQNVQNYRGPVERISFAVARKPCRHDSISRSVIHFPPIYSIDKAIFRRGRGGSGVRDGRRKRILRVGNLVQAVWQLSIQKKDIEKERRSVKSEKIWK